MIDICIALDQSVSPHTGVRTIQNIGVFWQAVFQPPRPYSLFLEHGSAAKTLISHPHNTASYAGYRSISPVQLFSAEQWGLERTLVAFYLERFSIFLAEMC